MSTRILVVDDDPLVRRSVERILLRESYEVVTAVDVAGAVRIAATQPLDAALVDFALTGEDGLQVLSRLRELQPSCLRILMTGRTDFPMVVDAVNRGEVLRVVRKPFDSRGLLDLLRDAFASAKRTAEHQSAKVTAAEVEEWSMLEDCLANGLLMLAIQPIVSAAEPNTIVAYEALLRSRHAVLASPGALLRVAERATRIDDLGREIFRLAAERLSRMEDGVGLFVNLHAHQLADRARLQRDILPLVAHAERVTLEITERSSLYEVEGWDEGVKLLGTLGFAVAIDDLGAGYNSLTMLADLQPRYIKLDMALVRNVDQEPRKQRLVQLMVTFADATNAQVVAEGVETPGEAAALVACGTHLLQGYYFGRPALESPPPVAVPAATAPTTP